ncbi:protein mono-ADP-ribosyltransferase PARP14-like [Watersipora subatra]|uniref:protein mono-ADP-ribosyltransferase PARP14-like n=1 Tax=Watersipora subatra TaxID=2589382 RepID=UPI00355C83A5
MIDKYKLQSFIGNPVQNNVTITGSTQGLDDVQAILIDLMHRLTKSKVGLYRKSVFVEVFKTDVVEAMVKKRLFSKDISAVWNIEDDTILVYAEDKKIAEAAVSCIDDLLWESLYPVHDDLDSLEREEISSDRWQNKVAELEKLYHPLVVSVLPEQERLTLASLSKFQKDVVDEIEQFFDKTIIREMVFNGIPNRIRFLKEHGSNKLKELTSKNQVRLGNIDTEGRIELKGFKQDLVKCQASLQQLLDGICKELHVIEHQTMIRHINEEPDFLQVVCRQTNCMVVHHKEEVIPAQKSFLSSSSLNRSVIRYSVQVSSGTTCEVKRGDITSMTCDAIVNAANSKLQHLGGLAQAIVKKGGNGIQDECTNYIQSKGQLMTGEVYISKAGRLNCKKIIHAVGPRWKSGAYGEVEALLTCVDNLLEAAVKHKLQSVAIPPISTGIFHYPLPLAVKTIIAAVNKRVSDSSALPQKIIFTDNKDDSLELFEKELKEKYEAKVSMPPSHSRDSTVSGDKYSISENKMLILNRVSLEIVEGDIVNIKTEALVNSVGTDFQLNHGKVAQALLAKAGPLLQKECTTLAPIKVGEIKVTEGHQLECQKIVHCNCPPYKGPDSLQTLQQLVINCLNVAASYELRSITFPSLGTGNLGYCGEDVATAMVTAIARYTEENPKSSIELVQIVIYHLDLTIKKCFENEFSHLAARAVVAVPRKRNLVPKDNFASHVAGASSLPEPLLKARLTKSMKKNTLKGCVTVNKTTIRVLQGDITEHCASVLVNSTDHLLSVRGQVSQAMVKKAGPTVKQEITSLARETPTNGIWVSTAGLLNADSIFHVDVGATRSWESLINNCLKTCDINQVTSIAFPALGTGALGLPSREMAKKLLQAIVTYVNDHHQTTLTAIDIVIFQEKMIQEFVVSMKKAIDKPDGWMKKLKITLSGWLSPSDYADVPDPELSKPVRQALLNLDIYGFSQVDIKGCKAELDKRLGLAMETIKWSEKKSYKEDKHYITALSAAQVQNLYFEADNLSVVLEIDLQRANITIVGLKRHAFKMAEIVATELRCVENDANERREANYVAMAISWMYHDGDKMVQFDPLINKALENLYQKNPQGTYSYNTIDGKITLNLQTMIGRDATLTEFEIKRVDRGKEPATLLSIPDTWFPPFDSYKEVVLDSASAEYATVERNFFNTFISDRHEFEFLPKTGKVLEVKRVQNATLYQQYIVLRKKVAAKLGKTEEEVERVPMWHGTNQETVSLIARGTFDRGLAGKNATYYGVGSYFATGSWYSRQPRYSRANNDGHRFMIQTRVIVGEFCAGNPSMRSAPPNPNYPGEVYDSVVNDVNDTVIFVVFNDAAAYPEYIVKFTQQ